MPRYKNTEPHIMISIEADDDYSEAVGIVAGRLKITKGQLVRKAVDAMIGPEVEATMTSFANIDARKGQLFHGSIER